jgi:AAA family ATP:ADP antiporter
MTPTDLQSVDAGHERPRGMLGRLVWILPGEGALVGWSWFYLFSVFASYYIIRPIRDEAGVAGGVANLSWLFTGTLLAMLAANPAFAALVRALPRRTFIAIVNRFFLFNLLVFMVLFQATTGEANIWVGRAFFVWTSVFNLFVPSVFWAFMVDLYTNAQSKRLFGFIAAAATVGGIMGAGLTAGAVQAVGGPVLLLASALLLEASVWASRRLSALAPRMATPAPATERDRRAAAEEAERPIGGSVLAGLVNAMRSPYLFNICLYMLLYTILSTFLYFQQAEIVDRTFTDRAARTAFFARIDLLINALTLGGQIFLTGRALKWAGVAPTLTVVPALTLAGFLWLGLMPAAMVVVVFTVLRRAGNFVFGRPSREVLFVVVSREDKYKTKNLIDTVVYRLGDQVGAWTSSLIAMAGLGAGAIAWTAVPVALAWVANAWWLGRRQEARARELQNAGAAVNAAGRPVVIESTPALPG